MRWQLLYSLALILLIGGCTSVDTPPAQVESATVPDVVLTPPPTPPVAPAQSIITGQAQPTPTLFSDPPADSPQAPVLTATPAAQASPAAPLLSLFDRQAEYTVAAAPGVPPELVAAAQEIAAANPERFAWLDAGADPATADILLTVNGSRPLARWVYAAAAPFATIEDSTTWADVSAAWSAGTSPLGRLIVHDESAATLTAAWGPPGAVQTVGDDLIGTLWSARPSWTLIPFHRLSPELKTLAVDGRSPLSADFVQEGYPLSVDIGLTGDEEGMAAFLDHWTGPLTNRDPDRLTRVAMTGVTALVRATAYRQEVNGLLYPGEEIAPVLQAADIAHVSNEVSFSPDCPYPDPYGGTTFCSRDSYFELLKHLGVDVVELTGNHLNDYGRGNLLHTLDMYADAGMAWFGGGRNLEEAIRPLIITHNDNRLAFVGCNPVGPANAWAEAELAGSRPCDPGFEAQIRQLRDEGHVVIATLQYQEFYDYAVGPKQRADFAALAAAGASAVSGSQGHHVQGFAFENDAFIHYGLGNLFFDQMDMMGTRQTFVDTYVIYDGRLLAVELWTGLIEDYARPRLMTPAERQELLSQVFQASGW